MENEERTLNLAAYLKKFTELTGAQLMNTLDPIAELVDRDLSVGNLGNNAVVNALIYVLDMYIARMSSYGRREQEGELYDQIHREHGKYLNELIAKYSQTKKSYMVEIPDEEEKNDP